MPQIAQLAETWSSQFFWLAIFFGITFFLIGMGMVPKVMDTVEKRDSKISDDLAAAKAARDAADEREEAWRVRENENREKARGIVTEAKADSAARSQKTIAAAQKRLDKKLGEAEIRIGEARNAALTEIEAVAIDAAQDIVQRVAGLKVTRPAAAKAVKETLVHG